jgi:hypothetical protein
LLSQAVGEPNLTVPNKNIQKTIGLTPLDRSSHVVILETITPLIITAKERGSRQKCRMNQYGFPRTGPKKLQKGQGLSNWRHC